MKPLPRFFFQEWTHSFEEDTEGILVYRPFDYDFPPSRRPRDGYEFSMDGRVVRYVPGPADASLALRGRFKHEEDNTLHLFIDGPRAKAHSIRIVACDEKSLRIKLV